MVRKGVAALLGATMLLMDGVSIAAAQNLCVPPPNNSSVWNCREIGFPERSAHVSEIISAILRVTQDASVSLSPIAVCRMPGLKNAQSIACPSGNRYDFRIFYDPAPMAEIDVRSNNKFVPIGFFAHEVGHFVELMELSQIPITQKSFGLNMPWIEELRADRHAGFVLAKLGASYADVQAWQRLMFAGPSFSHPGAVQRIEEMLRGYVAGGGATANAVDAAAVAREIAGEMSRW
jgi:hypothetical protein